MVQCGWGSETPIFDIKQVDKDQITKITEKCKKVESRVLKFNGLVSIETMVTCR